MGGLSQPHAGPPDACCGPCRLPCGTLCPGRASLSRPRCPHACLGLGFLPCVWESFQCVLSPRSSRALPPLFLSLPVREDVAWGPCCPRTRLRPGRASAPQSGHCGGRFVVPRDAQTRVRFSNRLQGPHYPQDPACVRNPHMLASILEDNVMFTRPPPHPDVDLQLSVCRTVSDTGCGLRDPSLHRVFLGPIMRKRQDERREFQATLGSVVSSEQPEPHSEVLCQRTDRRTSCTFHLNLVKSAGL